MLTELSIYFQLSLTDWLLASLVVMLIGMSKSGLKGIAVFNVAIFALIFGAKASTGILLSFLIVGDIIAIIFYNRHVQWRYLWKLIPWMIIGILFGTWVGEEIPDELFKTFMAIIIIISVVVLFHKDRQKNERVPNHWSFSSTMGLIAGFTTMIGNMAGAFTNIYFLSMRLPKSQFIGTAAWLFFITNLFKVPFHVYVWETIQWKTLQFNFILAIGVALGFLLGLKILSYIKEHHYRQLILILTAIGAVVMIIK